MRERTTWNRDQIKKAALSKRADPYLMNQDHVGQQPSADKYVIGDPSTFAEDVHPSKDTWEAEYANGQVKRNEIGMPEMRKDTFNHPEKTASREVLLKKANLCIRVASMMLGKSASENAIEDQSVALMHMPDSELVNTFNRLAGEGEEEKPMQQQAEMVQQSAYQQAMDQCKAAIEAGDEQGVKSAIEQMVQAQMAQQGQQAPMQQQSQQAPAMNIEAMVLAAVKKAQQVPMQQQSQQAPMQQQSQQVPMQQQSIQQQQAQQAPMQQQSDDMMLDEMLMDSPDMGLAEMDIEMDAPSMDVGDAGFGAEDEVLKTLFAADQGQGQGEEEQAQQAQQGQQAQQAQQGQAKQAMSRTASTRTVGTRPSGGVSRVGGGVPARSSDADRLSSLWASAPNVKDAFGL